MKKLTIILLLTPLLGLAQGLTTTTLSNGTWGDPLIWDNGLPSLSKSATINHNVTITSNSQTKHLTINDTLVNNGYLLETVNFINNGYYEDYSGQVVIRQNGNISGNDTYFYNLSVKGGSLTNTSYVRNLLNVINGVFNITSGNLVLVNDGIYDGRVGQCGGNVNGNMIWQKHIVRDCQGWAMYSFPNSPTLSDIGFFYTGVIGGPWPNFWANTYYYDETMTGGKEIGWTKYGNITQTVPQGSGLFHYDSPKVEDVAFSVTMTNTFAYNITYSPDTVASEIGWNLIGNPYPGTMDWDDPNWTKTNVANAIYTWSACKGGYDSYVAGVGTGDMDNLVPSGEAIWVQTIGTAPSLVVTKTALVDDSEPMMKKSNIDSNSLRVKLNGDDIIVRVKNGTEGFDYDLDAFKMGEGFLKTKDSEGNEYSINTLPNKQQTISLWTRGSGTLQFELNDLQNSWKIYLEDLYLNETQLLGDDYTFTSNTPQYEHRFNIIFTKKPLQVQYGINQLRLGIEELQINYDIIYQESQVTIISDTLLNVEVYDIMGRLLQKNVGNSVVIPRNSIKFVYINGRVEKIF